MDFIHRVFVKRALDPEVIESKCCEWIMMFIRLVNFKDFMAKHHFQQFLQSEPAVLQSESIRAGIIKHVCVTKSLCAQISLLKFVPLDTVSHYNVI